MQPVQELLSRIRWDKDYAKGTFSVAYYDRIEKAVTTVPFRDLVFDREDHFAFGVVDEVGEIHWVPYHRVRTLYRDGEIIWQRTISRDTTD